MELKLEKFNYLTENYLELINNLLIFSNEKDVLPKKISFCLPIIRNYLEENKLEVIQNSITYILENKEIILNFSLDSLEEDQNDNSINNLKNIYQLKKLINNENELEIINIIIEIKKNAKTLLIKGDIIIIKDYIFFILINT